MKYGIVLFFVLLFFNLEGQFYHTSFDLIGSSSGRSTGLSFQSVGDSQIVAAVYDVSSVNFGVRFEKLVYLNAITGIIEQSHNLHGNTPPFMPQCHEVRFFDRIGYLAYYDTAGPSTSFRSSVLRTHRFIEYGTNAILWEGVGCLQALPPFFRSSAISEVNGTSWFDNVLAGELLMIDLYTGDTLLRKSYSELRNLWNVDSSRSIGEISFMNSNLKRRDTLVARIQSWKLDSMGNQIDTKFYTFLCRFSSLERLSDLSETYQMPPGDAPSYRLKQHVDSIAFDFTNSTLKKTIYEQNRITHALELVLELDTLRFNPDTSNFPPRLANYRLLQNDRYIAYIENFKKPSPGVPSSTIAALKIRLYSGDSILYQKVLDPFDFTITAELSFTSYRLLPDGGVLLGGRDGLGSGGYEFLLLMDTTGQTSLTIVDSDPIPRDELQVFPTLVEDFLTIRSETEIEEVMVLSLNGKQLLPVKRIGEDRVDLSACASGWYLVLIKIEGQQRIFKVFKK